jgi:pyridoxal phosphate-dependent aminotransferase EpsN
LAPLAASALNPETAALDLVGRRAGPARTPVGQILLSPPHLTGGEAAAVAAALESGWLAPAGPVPAAFEAALGEAAGFGHVLATASGTAALHLGYRCLGVSPGDEVWAPALTFIATVAPAVQMGATPRFLDVDRASWTLDPDLLERELARAGRAGRLPRVVVPVDLFGQPCATSPRSLPFATAGACPCCATAPAPWARRGAAAATPAAARASPCSPSTATRSSPRAVAAPLLRTTRG